MMQLRQWSDAYRLDGRGWSRINYASVNDNKMEFMIIGTRKQMAKVNIDGLSVGESIIAAVTSVRNWPEPEYDTTQ